MICIDTMLLIWGVQGQSEPSQRHMVPKTQKYLQYLDDNNIDVILPAPALTEFLQGIDPKDHAQYIPAFSNFKIEPLDFRAARLAAELAHHAFPQLARANGKQGVRTDCMIAAIAIAAGADKIVTEDQSDFNTIVGPRIQIIGVPTTGTGAQLSLST